MVGRSTGSAVTVLMALAASPSFALETGQCLPMPDMNAALAAENQHSLAVGDRLDYEGQIVALGETKMTRAQWRDLATAIKSDTPKRRTIIADMKAKGRSQAQIDTFFAKLQKVAAVLELGDPDARVPQFITLFTANDDGSLGYILEGNLPSAQASTRACVRARLNNLKFGRQSALNLDLAVNVDVLSGQGTIVQTNGARLQDVAISLRGNPAKESAALVVSNSPESRLFYLGSFKLTQRGKERLAN